MHSTEDAYLTHGRYQRTTKTCRRKKIPFDFRTKAHLEYPAMTGVKITGSFLQAVMEENDRLLANKGKRFVNDIHQILHRKRLMTYAYFFSGPRRIGQMIKAAERTQEKEEDEADRGFLEVLKAHIRRQVAAEKRANYEHLFVVGDFPK